MALTSSVEVGRSCPETGANGARRRFCDLFLDASFFRMHPGSPAEPVLAARGINTDGKPVFVGLAPGTGADFLTDLRYRSFTCPLLVVLRRQIVNVETFDW